MKNIKIKFNTFQGKHITTVGKALLEKHTPTALILLAGTLIGFSLYSVNGLTSDVSSEKSQSETSTLPGTINLDKKTEQILSGLKNESDVKISSNIASYRRSAFSDVTAESNWIIEAANLLEAYKSQNGFYPRTESILQALKSQNSAFSATDQNGLLVNEQDSNYTYEPGSCTQQGCQTFLLTANLGNTIYQLGETDTVKRTWINDTAQALDVFRKFEDRGYYPLESNFVSELSNFYATVLKKEFISTDPGGKKVNDDGSSLVYRGINCDSVGCESFVLRTTFKDGASYFQQSQ